MNKKKLESIKRRRVVEDVPELVAEVELLMKIIEDVCYGSRGDPPEELSRLISEFDDEEV